MLFEAGMGARFAFLGHDVGHKFRYESVWSNGAELSIGSSGKKVQKTYNTRYSPVVTHLSTNPAVSSLSRAERTGCRVL